MGLITKWRDTKLPKLQLHTQTRVVSTAKLGGIMKERMETDHGMAPR